MVKALLSIWNSDRCDNKFAVLWDIVVREAESLGVEPPVLPRIRRIPRRLDDGSSEYEAEQVEDVYRRLYFSSLDAATTCLSSRFQNSAFELARNVESVVTEAINTGNVPALQIISAHYGKDIDDSRWHLHLSMLGDLCRSAEPPVTVASITDVVKLFTDNVDWLPLLPEVVNYELAPTISNFASHELHRRTKFLLSEATENFSSFHCNSEKNSTTSQYCIATVINM